MALTAGLVVLAVIAWAFSGAVDASGAAGGGTAGGAGASHGRGTQTGPGGHAAGRPGGTSAAGPVSASGTRPGSGSAAGSAGGPRPGSGTATRAIAHASPSASAQPSAAPAAQIAGQNQGPGDRVTQPVGPAPTVRRTCKPGDVVLSMFSSQDSYGQGRLPQFEVDVVSTSRRTCAFNVGPGFLAVVVTAAGRRVWSSARCAAGRGSLVTDLARGVPAVIPVTWDLETSAGGCPQPTRQVPPGGYAVSACDDGRTSNSLAFTVR